MRFRLLAPTITLFLALAAPSFAADDIVSTMRNVNAVTESRGFSLARVDDMSGGTHSGVLAPIQAFEIIRPRMEGVTIGRLYTSCTCVQLVSPKRAFARGERAVLELRNVRATPPQGQRYAIYVQITRPIRTTLRIDTFVQSSQFIPQPVTDPAIEPESAPAHQSATTLVEELAMEAEKKAVEAEEAQTRVVLETEKAVAEAPEGETEEEDTADKEAVQSVEPAPDASGGESVSADAATAANATDGVANRISVITLGVSDLSRSIKFYEDIGWKPAAMGKYDNIAFFQMNGMVLSLYPMEDLLRDQYILGRETKGGGSTLTILLNSRDEVEKTFQAFVKAGGEPLRQPVELPSGATTGYVADPDGHSWEISSAPNFKLNDKGEFWIE